MNDVAAILRQRGCEDGGRQKIHGKRSTIWYGVWVMPRSEGGTVKRSDLHRATLRPPLPPSPYMTYTSRTRGNKLGEGGQGGPAARLNPSEQIEGQP